MWVQLPPFPFAFVWLVQYRNSNDKFNLCYGFTNIDIEDIEYELEIYNPTTQEWEYNYCENIDEVNDLL